MNNKWIVVFFILAGISIGVYGLSKKPHEFSSNECSLCHFNEKEAPMNIKPNITYACETCHSEFKETNSHPTDIYPTLTIPKDMPLIEGRLTCITCHYIHPEKKQFVSKNYFLRREIRGPIFCSACHKIDEKGHILLENVHMGTYIVTDRSTRIDKMSLGCITCHDTYINEPEDFLGAGIWSHFNKKFYHPIGVSYEDSSLREIHDFRPPTMLSKEIRLFDGKIGCGTCHNIYSKEKFMLVIDNTRSRLCLECHIK